MDEIKHGTVAGYVAHQRRGQLPGPDDVCGCRAAIRDYRRRLRADGPTRVYGKRADPNRQRLAKQATYWARVRLARLHPDDYRRLLEEEQSRVARKGQAESGVDVRGAS